MLKRKAFFEYHDPHLYFNFNPPIHYCKKKSWVYIFYITNPIFPIQADISDSDERMLGIALISA